VTVFDFKEKTIGKEEVTIFLSFHSFNYCLMYINNKKVFFSEICDQVEKSKNRKKNGGENSIQIKRSYSREL
jgi:hypothetical protein